MTEAMPEDEAEANAPDALALTRMWGATRTIEIASTTPFSTGLKLQVADIRLPEPVTAAVFFQATKGGAPGTVQALTLDLYIGLGRTNVRRSSTFQLQPSTGSPLVFTLPAPGVPVVTLQADVTIAGFLASGTDPMTIECVLQLAPISRIHYQKEALKFGMALPGEADGLDDAMLEDLEEHAPDKVAIMRARQEAGDDPRYEEHDDEPGQIQVPPEFERIVAKLARRLGRPPKVRDLPPAIRKRFVRMLRAGA